MPSVTRLARIRPVAGAALAAFLLAPLGLRAADEPAKPAAPAPPPATRPATRPAAEVAPWRNALRDPVAFLESMRDRVLEMDLTKEQRDKAIALFQRSTEQLKERLAGTTGVERFTAVGEVLRSVQRELADLVGEEQQAKLRQQLNPAALREGAAATGERVATMLRRGLDQIELSDEQRKKVDEVVAGVQQQARALVEAAANVDREQVAEKFRTLVQEGQAKLNELLTPEQRDKLTKLREEARQRFERLRSGGGVDAPPNP